MLYTTWNRSNYLHEKMFGIELKLNFAFDRSLSVDIKIDVSIHIIINFTHVSFLVDLFLLSKLAVYVVKTASISINRRIALIENA